MKLPGCELCQAEGGLLVLANEFLRVVLVDDPAFPGFTRVIWHAHVREMTDLSDAGQQRLMRTVFAVERAQRAALQPAKINVASLGNVTPHLHWHVIPRFADDSHFPQPVWGTRQRDADAGVLAARRRQLEALRARIAEEVARVPCG
jgi:diadenosine tetraphosphate (Ap4A) HIT family hydrolase